MLDFRTKVTLNVAFSKYLWGIGIALDGNSFVSKGGDITVKTYESCPLAVISVKFNELSFIFAKIPFKLAIRITAPLKIGNSSK